MFMPASARESQPQALASTLERPSLSTALPLLYNAPVTVEHSGVFTPQQSSLANLTTNHYNQLLNRALANAMPSVLGNSPKLFPFGV